MVEGLGSCSKRVIMTTVSVEVVGRKPNNFLTHEMNIKFNRQQMFVQLYYTAAQQSIDK